MDVLSGGEKQRIAVCFFFVWYPFCVAIVDELIVIKITFFNHTIRWLAYSTTVLSLRY